MRNTDGLGLRLKTLQDFMDVTEGTVVVTYNHSGTQGLMLVKRPDKMWGFPGDVTNRYTAVATNGQLQERGYAIVTGSVQHG